jgi:hypothetical protein
MRKEVMKKWVKALRSGKFKQGQGTLKKFNKQGQEQYCCLGVLCELYNETMKKNKKKTLPEKVCDNDSGFSYGYCRFGGKKEDLPKEVMNWAGIGNSMGAFTNDNPIHDQYNLADLNDTGRKFTTIANIIEKNVENL